MIHPSTRQKADKLGLIGEDNPSQLALESNSYKHPKDTVQFHWPSKNVYAFGIGAKAAMAEMEAIMEIARMDADWRILNSARDPFNIELFNKDRSRTFIRGGATPQDTLAELNGKDGEREWLSTTVPDDGAEAFKQGFTAADNPFSEDDTGEDGESNPSATWDEQFDLAADAAQEEADAEDEPSGSVVKETYRLRYAEAGHPNHCGDWLADTLNGLILGKTHTDLDNFEALCNENDVSLSKYRREGNGWEGRLRMTGRNLLARKIYVTGYLHIPAALLPLTDGHTPIRAPREWIETRPYKGKSALDDEAYTAEPVVSAVVTEASGVDATPQELAEIGADAAGDPPPAVETVPNVADQMAKLRRSKGKK